jgi:hypothetical protein
MRSDAVVPLVFRSRRKAGDVRRPEPVTFGLPFPQGTLPTPDRLLLRGSDGKPLPLQTRLLDRWPDGSARWVLLDFDAADDPQANPPQLEIAETPVRLPLASRIVVSRVDRAVVVDTGGFTFRLNSGGLAHFEVATAAAGPAPDATSGDLLVADESGISCQFEIDRLDIEETGPIRAVVRAEGIVRRASGQRLVDAVGRYEFFAGRSIVRCAVSVSNPRGAHHDGGYWELGDSGSIYLRDVSFRFQLRPGASATRTFCSPEVGHPLREVDTPLDLYQDSSGGENWNSVNHVNRHGNVPLQFRGYRLTTGASATSGLRATPVVALQAGSRAIVVAMEHFWQNHPKAIETTTDSVLIRLFPRHFGDVHELQGGERKTHTFFVGFDSAALTEEALAWFRDPVVAGAEPAWYCESGAIRHLTTAAGDPSRDHVVLVNQAVEGETSFERKREIVDEYGWRHFGDIYADHESAFNRTGGLRVSHYNNQYDAIAGMACQYLKSGDLRWWAAFTELAAHVADIDVYHTDEDKSAYTRGYFWHTTHYVDAGRSTHRGYPRAEGVTGGGPSSQHNYATGFMLHYFLTGAPTSRDTALDLARWVVNMEDGRKTPLRWLTSGDTGLSTATGSELYAGPSRGSGNSLRTLVNAFNLTGDATWLRHAERVIRRSIHPADDLEKRELTDPERRWFYMMFLHSLGEYLDVKAEHGELDFMYAYGRAGLLHYARWMAVNEYPYLEKPEKLEFPTETWAAQEMRKCDVFNLAAIHASGDERLRFRERAAFFFNYCTTKLGSMPTRGFTRPVVLLLTLGFLENWLRLHPDHAAPPGPDIADFGKPEAFVPQKIKAIRRLKMIAAIAAILVMALAAFVLTRFIER